MEALWQHQERELKEHLTDPARAILWEPRTGKTRLIAEWLRRLPRWKRALIVVPKTIAGVVWVPELRTRIPFAVVDLTEGSVEHRRTRLAALRGPYVVVINYDVLWPLRFDLRKWRPDVIVLDESHLIKRSGARRSMAAHLLGPVAAYRRTLTGTPSPKSLRDFFSQYKFVDPSIFGTSREVFDGRFCIMHPLYPDTVRGYRNVEELRKKIFSIASRVRREECFDVPKDLFITRRMAMPTSMRKVYDGLAKAAFSNRLERLLRLQQFTSGILPSWGSLPAQALRGMLDPAEPDDLGGTLTHDLKARMVAAELDETLDAGNKAVVWCRFRLEQQQIAKTIEANYPDVEVWQLNGDTSKDDREEMERAFRTDSHSQVIVSTIQTGRLGLSFAEAQMDVFASLTFDYEHYEQALLRTFKPGHPRTHVFIELEKTVDQLIFKANRKKQNISLQFLDQIQWAPDMEVHRAQG